MQAAGCRKRNDSKKVNRKPTVPARQGTMSRCKPSGQEAKQPSLLRTTSKWLGRINRSSFLFGPFSFLFAELSFVVFFWKGTGC